MYCSRDSFYKNPTGAVRAGEKVHFKLALSRDFACSSCSLMAELDGCPPQIFNMFWCGMDEAENIEWWECDFTPTTTGLYFYYFEFRTDHGMRKLSRGKAGTAILQGTDKWQLTVYSSSYETPKWLEGGIIYQIFPDRFFSSGTPKENVPAYRKIHENWGEEVDWQPNAEGVITNTDFFGGDLEGITQKLMYLRELGVTCIYLNPIFRAYSNHRYDTADYSKIDVLLGDEKDFAELCEKARSIGIHVILDGVFSHTGSDSIYFNKDGTFDSIGAYNSTDSPYYSWYNFEQWPDKYDSWWGFDTLPNVKETTPAFNEYINGENGIIRKWLRLGADGWRLDVADELPDEFLDHLNSAVKAEKPDGIVLGEVWEDASTKTAYGERRRYLLGNQLDSVMNYPFYQAIVDFLMGGDSEDFFETVEQIVENYPAQTTNILMNHIGTHDTQRILTIFGGEPLRNKDREWQSTHFLNEKQRDIAVYRLKLASLMQYTLPGVPCIYYGDEVGLEGYKDPFSRRTYPWNNGDTSLLEWYKSLGSFRHSQKILATGEFARICANDDTLIYKRFATVENTKVTLTVIINRGTRFQSIDPAIIKGSHNILGMDLLIEENELEPFGYSVYIKHEHVEA